MDAPLQPATIRSPWWYVARLILFRPGLYLLSALGIVSFYLWPLVTGSFIRQIFDQLSNRTLVASDARATLWTLAGVLIGVAVAHAATALAFPFGEKAAMLVADTLMRHNLLQSILGRPGANALPPDSSPGEVVSRLRDVGWRITRFTDDRPFVQQFPHKQIPIIHHRSLKITDSIL